MIQRIQTIYLFLITLCFTIILFFPIAEVNGNILSVWSFKSAEGAIMVPTFYLGLLSVLIAVISASTIFLYKNRMLQNKLCVSMFILIIILLGMMYYVYPEFVIKKAVGENATLNYTIFSFIAVLPLAFVILANKAILKDEKKVRAADRLR